MIDGVRSRDGDFASKPEVILDVEVIAPGQIGIRGIWRNDDRAIVVQPDCWIVPRSSDQAMLVNGNGRVRRLQPVVDRALFEDAFKVW